jgi:hypothetical protein
VELVERESIYKFTTVVVQIESKTSMMTSVRHLPFLIIPTNYCNLETAPSQTLGRDRSTSPWGLNRLSGSHPFSEFLGSRRLSTKQVCYLTHTLLRTLRARLNGTYEHPFQGLLAPSFMARLSKRCPDGSLALAHCENRTLQYLDT